MNKAIQKFNNSPRVNRVKTLLFALMISIASMPVFAEPAGDFDPAPISAKITLFIASCTLLVGAMIGARWGKHVFGLLSPKG